MIIFILNILIKNKVLKFIIRLIIFNCLLKIKNQNVKLIYSPKIMKDEINKELNKIIMYFFTNKFIFLMDFILFIKKSYIFLLIYFSNQIKISIQLFLNIL